MRGEQSFELRSFRPKWAHTRTPHSLTRIPAAVRVHCVHAGAHTVIQNRTPWAPATLRAPALSTDTQVDNASYWGSESPPQTPGLDRGAGLLKLEHKPGRAGLDVTCAWLCP